MDVVQDGKSGISPGVPQNRHGKASMDEVAQEEARAEFHKRKDKQGKGQSDEASQGKGRVHKALPDHGELPSAAGIEHTFSNHQKAQASRTPR